MNYIFSNLKKFKTIFFFLLIIILFKITFGLFFPIFIVCSDSMKPYYSIGDMVIIQNKSIQYNNFEIIVFYPYGNHKTVPIIHRVQYFINKGEVMWLYGPIAKHSGFITKGDNIITNKNIDQKSLICSVPIKKEWILGSEKLKLKYIGKLKLFFYQLLH